MLSTIISILLTLLILSFIVVVHEWGHFIVAKHFKVNVEEFSVGMGWKIFSFNHKGTMYSLRALPVGGYCKMSDNMENGSETFGYNDISLVKRILISVSGPLMNFVLSFAVVALMAMFTGISTTDVIGIKDGTNAESSGIEVGDTIVEYGGHSIKSRAALSYYASMNGGEPVDIVVKRAGQKVELNVKPTLDENRGLYVLGVMLDYKAPVFDILNLNNNGELTKAPLYRYVTAGFWNTVDDVRITFFSFGGIVDGSVSVKELSGPIGMVSMVDGVVEDTVHISIAALFLTLFEFAGLISISLGIINLLPLPALDGGRIFIYLFELLFGKEMSPKVEGAIHAAGFILLMGLGIYIAFIDITKIL